MKYEVSFEEVIRHTFDVDADCLDNVLDELVHLADNGQLDFSHGEVVASDIVSISAENKEQTDWTRNSFADAAIEATRPKVAISLGNDFSLVAEVNPDPAYKELFVYLLDERNGLVYQDLAVIGEEYYCGSASPENYSVKVYTDEVDEDWTFDHHISRLRWVSDIDWDTDGQNVDLPTEIPIQGNVPDEDIADYLSDHYGFCVKSFSVR